MTRVLQSLLTLTILFIGAKLCMVAFLFFKIDRLRDYDPGPGLRQAMKFEASVGEWPFTIGRYLSHDSVQGKSTMQPFIGFREIKPGIRKDDELYLMDGNRKNVLVRFDEERFMTMIPLTEEKYVRLKALFIVLFLITSVLYFYSALLLYRFVRTAGQKAFFDSRNAVRLKYIGWFILLVGTISMMRVTISMWLMEFLTGLRGVIFKITESPINFYYLIAGLLLLVIAEAFKKGNQLQTEQDYTI